MNLFPIIPEILILAIAIITLLLAVFWDKHPRHYILDLIGLGLVIAFVFSIISPTPNILIFGTNNISNEFTNFFRRFFIFGTILGLGIIGNKGQKTKITSLEFPGLVLLTLIGMMFVAAASDFVTLFITIELVTVEFLILVAFDTKNPHSVEAGIKYMIFGGVSAAFMVMGIAFIYGSTGTLLIKPPTQQIGQALSTFLYIGFGLFAIGICFKLALVPLQMWAPDVYQGASSPVSALLASCSKAMGFLVILKTLCGLGLLENQRWQFFWACLAVVSIIYGCFGASVQFDFKRLLGWSSIVHAGFMALGISTASKLGLIAIIFYLISYMLAVIIAFAIADELEKNDYSVNLSDLAGLFNKSPFAASALAISMVSLAGIPLTGGFIAKFLIVKSILVCAQTNAFFYLPIAIAVLSVAVSVYYYFKVIKIAFWTQRLPNSELQINLNAKKRIIMAFCVAGIILMGVLPNLFIEMSDAVITSLVK